MSDCPKQECPNTAAPKCCPPPKKECPVPPAPCKLPDTLTFTCPADDCKPKPLPFCPEKKEEKCVCVGPPKGCPEEAKKEEKKC